MGCCMSEQALTTKEMSKKDHQSSNRQADRPQQREQRQRSQRSHQSSSSQQQSSSQGGGLRLTYLQNPHIEKVLQGEVVGQGIKKTPAYNTPLSQEELNKERSVFWETRTSGSQQIWELLRTCCEMEDQETAVAMITAADLDLPQNSLTTAIDTSGLYYRVPIFCINDPKAYNKNEQLDKMKSKKAPKTVQFEALKIRSVHGDKTCQVSSTLSISELKQHYCELLGNKAQPHELRFFCMGKELQDDLFLYSYDISDEMTIQAMVKKSQNN